MLPLNGVRNSPAILQWWCESNLVIWISRHPIITLQEVTNIMEQLL